MIKKEFAGFFGGYNSYLYIVIFNKEGVKKNVDKKERKRACQVEQKREFY